MYATNMVVRIKAVATGDESGLIESVCACMHGCIPERVEPVESAGFPNIGKIEGQASIGEKKKRKKKRTRKRNVKQ